MYESSDKNIQCLIDLLDDDNEQSASLAMAELLKRDSVNLDDRLRIMQETDDPRMRRRIHQLEAALRKRRFRSRFIRKIEADQIGLLAGLIQLHLYWFDNDVHENVVKKWARLRSDFQSFHPKNIQELSIFMQKNGFRVSQVPGILPDYYCVGFSFDENLGSDLILSAICIILSIYMPNRMYLFRCGSEFGVMDRSGNLMFPSDDWKIYSGTDDKDQPVLWGTREIMRYVSTILFLSATSADGYRYMYTIGTPLAASLQQSSLDFLPYPYGKMKRPD